MIFVADLHVHSRYSRATSSACTLEGLHRWAQLKGVRVVGTGDATHPGWAGELAGKLVPSAPGLFRLREDLAAPIDAAVPLSCRAAVEFMVTAEVSSIYRRAGRVRKVHSLLLFPDLAAAGRPRERLAAIGNIASDGRPILGLDPRDLLRLAREAHPAIALIPAHVWTPWFSVLGAKSGFDSVEEAFGDLTPEICAIETGLSSDPPMNWRVSSLDPFALVSNSDLHSPFNLARNANLFHGEPDYFAMVNGLRRRDPAVCGGTVDLYPEEGKYHLDGHRACGYSRDPAATGHSSDPCPVCGRPLVPGVLRRVVELADRPAGTCPAGVLPHRYIVPLCELLGEIMACGPATRRVANAYLRLLADLGPELRILLDLPLASLDGHAPALLAEAVRRVREGRVFRRGGYDGVYGTVRVLTVR
jgi:PHP family Zn ribbon phosphoesterase